MKILGIDPGTLTTGFGIVDYTDNKLTCISSGAINTNPKDDISCKLKTIYDNILSQIKIHNPDEFAIETAFYSKNVQSTLKIGYARGVALLAASHSDLPVSEFSPREVKSAVVGNGNASKEQIRYMVSSLLNKSFDNSKLDETDALAIAICHAFRKNSIAPTSKSSWKDFIKNNPDRIVG